MNNDSALTEQLSATIDIEGKAPTFHEIVIGVLVKRLGGEVSITLPEYHDVKGVVIASDPMVGIEIGAL